MKKPTRILIVEDVVTDADLAKRAIRNAVNHCEFQVVETRGDFLSSLETYQPDVILADYTLPRFDGMNALKLTLEHAPLTPLIIWTGSTSEDVAVDCMKAGANNYVLKDNLKRLGPAVIHALEERQLLLQRSQAEEKYQAIFENSVVGVFQSTPDGRFINVNAAMARIYGYDSPQAMIQEIKNIPDQIYVDSGKRAEFTARLHSQNTVENYEQRNFRRDGSVIWTSTSARVVREPNGNVLYYEGFITDITARKHTEQSLQERERQLTILFSNLPGPVYRCLNDDDHTMEFISDSIMDLSGYESEDFRQHGRHFGKMIHPDDKERVWMEIQVAVEKNEPFELTYRIITATGAEKWVWDKGQGIRNVEGQLQALEGFITDITERKIVEEKLKESETKYRTLIEHLPAITYISELDQYIGASYISPQIESLGFNQEEWLADPELWFRQIDPEDQGRVSAELQKFQDGGDAFRSEYRLLRQDGETRWLHDESIYVRDQEGRPIFKQGFMLDITEQKQAEDALRQSQMQYRHLVETSHDLIWSIDADGRFTFVNRAAREIYGYEPEDLIGRSFFELLDPEYYRPEDLEKFKETLAHTDELREVESYVQHRDGRQLILSANSMVLRDAEDRPLGVTGHSRDITARKQVENMLKAERNLLRTLIDNLPDRIYAMDAQGRKTLSNTADWKASGGKAMEDVIGKTDYDLYPPELAEGFWQLNQSVLESGTPVINHEEPGLDEDGNRVSILTTKIPLRDEEGYVFGLVGIGKDITERKQAEARINDLLAFNERILNYSPLGIFTYKLTGECVFANENAARMVGASVEQLGTQNFHAIESWKKSGLYELVEKAIQTHTTVTADIHHLSTFGKDVWLTAHCVTFSSKDEEHVLLSIADITDRKLAEVRLRQSENRYRLAIKATNDVIWEWNAKTNRLLWSENARHVFGYSTEEIGPEAGWWDDHIHPDDRTHVQSKLNALIAGKESLWLEEYRFRVKGGSYAYISDRGCIERDENGAALRMIGAMSDITHRKESEVERQALLEIMQGLANTNDLQELLKLIHHSIAKVIYAENFFVVLYRPGSGLFEEIYLVDQYDLPEPPSTLEKSITSYVFHSGEPLLLTQARFAELIAQGEVKLVGTDSKSWLGVPLKTSGKTIGVMAVQDYESENRYSERDKDFLMSTAAQVALVIERKQAEEALRESEQHHRVIFEGVQDAIFVESIDGRILMVNERACEMFGYSRAEFLTKTVSDLVPEGSPILMASGTDPMLSSEPRETLNLRANGEAFPIEISGRILVINGELVLLVVVRDITERKQAEAELRRSHSLLYATLESTADGILVVEPDGRISNFNQKFLELWHIPDRLAAKRDDRILLDYVLNQLKDPASFVSKVQFLYQSPEATSFDELEFCDGRIFERFSQPQRLGNDIVGRVWSFRDITERKGAEDELRRRAEETSALLKTSLALTNLDLKAILQTISNSAKNLFAADGCRVFLMEPDGKSLRCVLALQENSVAFSDLIISIDEGVTGAVAAKGKAEIVNEMQNDPRSVQVSGTPEEEEAIMFAPLREREHTIGVLSIRRTGTERPFQPADLELLEAFASMAAAAVSNARLFEETQRRLAELEALYENGLAVGRLLKPAEIGSRIIDTFAHHLRWHHVTIRLRKGNSEDLELVAFNVPNLKEEDRSRVEQGFMERVSKVGQGLSGWAIQIGSPIRTGDVHAHPQYIDMHAGIQSGLYMPLRAGERVIGVISVESQTPNAFTEQDERLLATLASQAAIAFENARLYQAIEQELSERKWAEEALRLSETHYRELADSITDILFELDQNLRYTHWNKASELLTSIPVQEAIGKSMHEIFGESEEQNKIGRIYEEVLVDRQPRTFETMLIVNGEKRYFDINAYPSTRGVSVVAKDVTDRKRSETIMQKRFELMEYSTKHTLNELMQQTVDEVSELTGSSIGFFHFVETDQTTLGMKTWSTNALRMFNVPMTEGTHLPLDQAGVWAEAVRQQRPLIQNDYESLTEKKRLPRGHVPVVREIVIPILRNERIVAVMGIGNKPHDYAPYDLEIAERLADYAWDITERKKMEDALAEERNQLARRVEERTADLSRANSNLARALRVKDEFLANMSHELRTPLNAILGLSESLAEQIAGPLNEKQQKYITTISESGHHLLSLINDILDLAKIEAGQITLDINKVDIHSVCQASLRMTKQLAQKKNQEVILDIEDKLGLMWADERRLKQMIVNLLGNAVKFTPENGKIGLEVRGDKDANKITITVWDNGIGISEDDIARLFQPFIQLDSGLARETTGTGLGLALVAQMARLHGGSVNAVSEPGSGSRFAIILPWEPALTLDTAARLRSTGKFPAIKSDESKRPTILLVEDTKEVIMMLRDYLELAGYNIVTAQDGMDAIVQARLAHPDLILMDIQMPRMDGLEATRRLRSEPNFRYTPIIALTALAMPNDRERCLAAGMDEYISKPINLKALVKIIQDCLFQSEEPESR